MQATIFIRKENTEKWLAIANRSAWVNTLLNNTDDTSNYGKTIDTPARAAVTVLTETIEPDKPILTKRNEDMKFCKHNAVIGFCKKGCTK